MDLQKHYGSLTSQAKALQDRVRNLVPHWPTDGEWKEAVLRSILRGHLPSTVEVVRGFVVTESQASTQIDILLYHNSKPTLFRDGDLVIVTPDAVAGIIEVKTRIDNVSDLRKAAKLLATAAALIDSAPWPAPGGLKCVGLFAYESRFSDEHWREILAELQGVTPSRDVKITSCLGDSLLGLCDLGTWSCFSAKGLAYGYFINSIITSVSGPTSVDYYRSLWLSTEGLKPLGELRATGSEREQEGGNLE